MDNLDQGRWLGVQLRNLYVEKYRKRWEIERTNEILESFLGGEAVWYVRDYNTAIKDVCL